MTPSSHSHLEVLAVALDRLDRAPGPRRDPDEAGRIEAHHLLVDERGAQRGRGPVDGVALRHRPPTVGPGSRRRVGGCRRVGHGYGQLADVGEGEADQAVVAAGHLLAHAPRRPPRPGVNQARSSASCVGWQSPSTGTT